ncbi:hypothetical protein [Paenibacillus sedimenti]|uniref:hypothetical protein n=1 Tax=Paenibacillus sedimenti TaxID=2770274 RepID=UPI001CB6FF9C|nr:hypothetical protein [Paenibacillus sedimenti]
MKLKYPVEVRDAKLNEILDQESWIIEGAHYKWGHDSFKKAEVVFIIEPNKYFRDFRVIRRFIRTRIGLEQSNYKQSLKDLYQMLFIWNRGFDKNAIKEIKEITNQYKNKKIVVKRNEEILDYIQDHMIVTPEGNIFK